MEKLEIHYYLDNYSHSMDAFIKNKAEGELLKLFKEVSLVLELDLQFESEAIEPGGIKEFLKLIKKGDYNKDIKKILSSIGLILVGVLTNHFSTNHELENLKVEEKKLIIKQLKNEIKKDSISNQERNHNLRNLILIISDSNKIKLYKSNFYSTLLKENKIRKISTTQLNKLNEPISNEIIINRSNFNEFVIQEFNIEPEIVNNANIEIVSPVLKRGKIKWKGIYNNKPISFNLLDSEFKNSVLNRDISFSNGTSINCTMVHERTIDNEGNLKIKEINIYDVMEVFQDNKTLKTKEKRSRKKTNQIKF